MKVALIGTGGIAQTHAKAIRDAGHQLTAVTDVDPARARAFAEKWQTRGLPDAAAILAEPVDLVTVATPNRFHFEISARALRAGRAVLCEKPLTRSPAQSRELAT